MFLKNAATHFGVNAIVYSFDVGKIPSLWKTTSVAKQFAIFTVRRCDFTSVSFHFYFIFIVLIKNIEIEAKSKILQKYICSYYKSLRRYAN